MYNSSSLPSPFEPFQVPTTLPFMSLPSLSLIFPFQVPVQTPLSQVPVNVPLSPLGPVKFPEIGPLCPGMSPFQGPVQLPLLQFPLNTPVPFTPL